MESGRKQKTVEILVFGRLRRYLDENGLPYTLERQVEEDGSSAYDLAGELGLPPEEVEAVFRNGRVQNIYDPVHPGDRTGPIPGQYQACFFVSESYFLMIYSPIGGSTKHIIMHK